MSKAYEKHLEFLFTVDGEVLLITDWGKDFVRVEEERKNGQEDCHMVGVLVRTMADTFVWEEGEKLFARYVCQGFADNIREYITKHGIPK
jgi:predicted pyridoxine 5'-phosphate oxidase superfamily flavin-nucleotide-binding protein